MNIPGIIAKHKVVTKQCRTRPFEDIKTETVDELWDAYLECIGSWPPDSDVKFHFVLTVEMRRS